MAHTFEIEVDGRYRILVVAQAIDWGWQYFPQERREGKWWWMQHSDGSTVCFRSRKLCDQYIEVDRLSTRA